MYLSTQDFSEMYLSTFHVLYKLYLSTNVLKYLSTDVLKYKVLLPGSAIDDIYQTIVPPNDMSTATAKEDMRPDDT